MSIWSDLEKKIKSPNISWQTAHIGTLLAPELKRKMTESKMFVPIFVLGLQSSASGVCCYACLMKIRYPWINASPTEFHDVPISPSTKILWFIWFRPHAWQPCMSQCCIEHGPRLRSKRIAQVIRVQYQSETVGFWGFLVQSSRPSLEIVQFHHFHLKLSHEMMQNDP